MISSIWDATGAALLKSQKAIQEREFFKAWGE
jgi:hypothetical protein